MKSARGKADTELVRQQNRSLILEALRHHGALASIELGEVTGLSPATISSITNDMLSERLIEADKDETERTRNMQRGRPKVKLKLTNKAALVLGLYLQHNEISMVLADFCGTIIARHTIKTETAQLTADAFGALLVDRTKAFLTEQKALKKRLSIISVACQGSVDAGKGEIIWSPAFSARNIPVSTVLRQAFDAPCLVANDTNTIAHLLRVEQPDLGPSFAVLYLGSGVGLGLYVNDALLEGTHGSASEFGHMIYKENGALCRCGRRGCIEAYASDFGIMRSANKSLTDVQPSEISPSADDIAALADQARKGEATAKQAFDLAGSAIGTGLANLVMLVAPRSLLFTGPGIQHFDLLAPPIRNALQNAARYGNEPTISLINDDRNMIESGLLALAYTKLDQEIFAKRVSVADVAARHHMAQ